MAAKSYKDLRVYQLAFESAVKLYEYTKAFPPEERYSLTDQIRRSSRSVCANVAEAWRKRRYPNNNYDHICSQLSIMMSDPKKWTPRTGLDAQLS